MPSNKQQTAFRLSEHARELLFAIADSLGISATATVEIIIREAAKKRGISVE